MSDPTGEPGVDRCVCHDVSFAELLRLSRERGWGFAELQRESGCCTGCAMCEPYARRALQTGETTIPLDLPG